MIHQRVPQLLALLAVLGLGVSGYLVATHYGDQPIECGGVGDCNYVNSSEYASVGGIPVSVLGVAMYVGLLAAAVYWSLKPADEKRMIAYWGLALSGVGYAAYLTYVELEILHAICVYCVISAGILAVSFLIATWALFTAPVVVGDGAHRVPPATKTQNSKGRAKVAVRR
jgi:uncharacterized membrane protein